MVYTSALCTFRRVDAYIGAEIPDAVLPVTYKTRMPIRKSVCSTITSTTSVEEKNDNRQLCVVFYLLYIADADPQTLTIIS